MKSARISVLNCAVAGLLLASCSDTDTDTQGHADDRVAHWGYEADNGPANWDSMNSEWDLCSEGREQSPIDLASATQIDLPAMEIRVAGEQGASDLVDNGHGIQINAKSGDSLTVGDSTYALLQFHFHAPSEHTVGGEHYPMEIHFVHRAENGALAVVGVLVEEGAPNPVIAAVVDNLTQLTDTATTAEIPAGFADAIFPDIGTGIYHYDGSITTPPCSEGLKWYVRKTPTQFSKDQIAAFTAIYDHNNRPVQPLNARTLYLDETPDVSVH